ncbi:MAG: NDP-sugar synthase [Elusimicrobia bacterium]|nr:NDP-sugar synthase [Elusimicrobiota bacterium]
MNDKSSIACAGIIAAGEGARLAASFPDKIKPLVPVAGVPLCHWIAGALRRAGVREITILLNNRGHDVPRSLESAFPAIRWSFLFADTASSWESFRLVCRALSERCDDFLVSTVDALIRPEEISRFASAMRGRNALAGLALTDFIDDEKPLYADLEAGWIRRLGQQAQEKKFATAGLYFMTREIAVRMPEASRFSSLRDYLAHLTTEAGRLAGEPISKSIDVDRPQDIRQAENFLEALRW